MLRIGSLLSWLQAIFLFIGCAWFALMSAGTNAGGFGLLVALGGLLLVLPFARAQAGAWPGPPDRTLRPRVLRVSGRHALQRLQPLRQLVQPAERPLRGTRCPPSARGAVSGWTRSLRRSTRTWSTTTGRKTSRPTPTRGVWLTPACAPGRSGRGSGTAATTSRRCSALSGSCVPEPSARARRLVKAARAEAGPACAAEEMSSPSVPHRTGFPKVGAFGHSAPP